MKWLKSKYFILLIIIGLAIFFIGKNYLYKPHKSIENQTAIYEGSADDFIIKMKENEQKYQNQIVILNGKITNIENNTIVLNNSIFCQLKNSINNNLNKVKVKGRIIGFDNLLDEIKMDQVIILKEN